VVPKGRTTRSRNLAEKSADLVRPRTSGEDFISRTISWLQPAQFSWSRSFSLFLHELLPSVQKGWKISLCDPFDQNKAAEVVYLKNFSLSTSGNYERFFKMGGKMYSHIMDPHTGMPVKGLLSACTFTERTTDSDGLSTALYVLGVEASRNYLARHPNIAAIFYLPSARRRRSRACHFSRRLIVFPQTPWYGRDPEVKLPMWISEAEVRTVLGPGSHSLPISSAE
jgi:hypothetical protein